jgi:hypothetical protein
MNYQGQSIITRQSTDSPKSAFHELYSVSEERADELRAQMFAHIESCKFNEGIDLQKVMEEMPIDAQTPNELALVSNYLGQFMAKNQRQHNPLRALIEVLAQ